MNVKIAYSVPFERVPSKIEELLLEASKELEIAAQNLRPAIFEEDVSQIIKRLEAIEKTRKKLGSVDFLLEDCYAILAGYNKTLAEMKMPKETKQNEQPSPKDG